MEQIIDGIDVSKCKFYDDDNGIGRCFCARSDGWVVYLTANYSCVDNPNCYYKQLKRKEQENKHLTDLLNNALAEKEKYENAIDDIKGYVNRYWGCANYRQSKDILMIIKKAKEN